MPGSDGRAHKMRLLARVEQAREVRCRAALRDAETGWRHARVQADTATAAAERAREERFGGLRGAYAAMIEASESRAVHALRATEIALAAQETAAQREQAAAAAAVDQALAACRDAQAALQAVSLRSQRRTKLADTLRREAALAAMSAEEEAMADELMDRIGTGR